VDEEWGILEEDFRRLLAYHRLGELGKPSNPQHGIFSREFISGRGK
jgi:hypothetical protein